MEDLMVEEFLNSLMVHCLMETLKIIESRAQEFSSTQMVVSVMDRLAKMERIVQEFKYTQIMAFIKVERKKAWGLIQFANGDTYNG